MHSWIGIILTAMVVLTSFSPVKISGWWLAGDELEQHALRDTKNLSDVQSNADLNSDGQFETLELINGSVVIRSGRQAAWHSPPAWDVHQAVFTNLNHDDRDEVALIVWRQFSPWPIDRFVLHGGRIASFKDDRGRSCHLILIGWDQGQYREQWAGSALAEPLLTIAAADLDDDGQQELVARETSYASGSTGTAVSIWEWNGFGFSLITRRAGWANRFQINRTNINLPYLLIGP